MKIALAQFNPVVGDLNGNAASIRDMIDRGSAGGADLVVFSELSLLGYPPRDLLRKESFLADCQAAIEELATHCTKTAALVGYVRANPDSSGRELQNAAVLLAGGEIKHIHVKSLLPTYDVFDETRYFQPGTMDTGCVTVGDTMIGISICEDLWDAEALGRDLYGKAPIESLVERGARIIVNMAASPYQVGKAEIREDLFSRQSLRSDVPIVYVNQVGGNDELLFDGSSCVFSSGGKIVARAKSFAGDLLIVDMNTSRPQRIEPLEPHIARLSNALKMGIRDYIVKCGLGKVVLGLSGGIDSAVAATLAADALGPQNVMGIAMPSRYSSSHSLEDAKLLAENLKINFKVVEIEPMHAAFENSLNELLADGDAEIAWENIQARIRGNIIMAYSNAHGHLGLATGNKSELAVGYCTLYGDMCGGLAPLGDVLKTEVYQLAKQLNDEAGFDRIPPSTISKAPSAELKPGQFDQDKLPEYAVLDKILRMYIEDDLHIAEIAKHRIDIETVRRTVRMVDLAEYKRKQAAIVLKVSQRAFGTGRRVPIAQKYWIRSGK